MTQLKTRIPLRLPKQLHGRDSESAQLLTAFSRVSDWHPEVVFISGEPGMGKTALVESLRAPVQEIHGFFISGKFEQNARHKPLSALIDALNSLAEQILQQENKRDRAAWANCILQRVGANASTLVELVPGMQAVIGEQPPPDELEPEQARIRMQSVVLNTLHAVSDNGRTLVVFLDDLQWADTTTLELEKILVKEEQSRILLVGTYRSTEVGPEHPLTIILTEQRAGHADHRLPLTEIQLGALKGFDLQSLLVDVLQTSRKQARELAMICQDRTGGNPFHMLQFLLAMQDRNFLHFDRDARCWQWDEDAIRGLPASMNVVDLLASRISRLGEHLRTPLGEAACFGSRFPLQQLASICHAASLSSFARAIRQLLEEGFLVPQSDLRIELAGVLLPAVCRFAHDRIEEAAYSSLDDPERLQTHLRIGWALDEAADGLQRDAFKLDAAGQLLLAQSRLHSRDDRLRAVGILLDAARIARRMTAWSEACRYASAGRDLLTPKGWIEHPATMTALSQLALEACYFTGSNAHLDELLQECTDSEPEPLQRAEFYRIRCGQMIMSANWDRAICFGLKALHTCFDDISETPDISASVLNMLEQDVDAELARLGMNATLKLPSTEDPCALFAYRTLPLVTFAAFPSGNLQMRSYLALIGMRIALRKGVCTQAFPTLGAYTTILGSWGRFRQAGRLALEITQDARLQHDSPLYAHGVNAIAHRALHFAQPFDQCIALLARGRASGISAGDPFIAAICLSNTIPMVLAAGRPLADVTVLVDELSRFNDRWNFPLVKGNVAIFGTYIRALQRHSALEVLENKQAYPSPAKDQPSSLLSFWFNQFRLQTAFWLGNTEAINECLDHARTTLPVLMGFPQCIEFYFIEYLHAPSGSTTSQQPRLDTARQAVMEAAESSEDNYGPLFQILEAERSCREGLIEAACQHLRRAIMLGSATGNLPYQALASERLAQLNAEQGKEGIAAGLRQQAERLYREWGCPARASRLSVGTG